MRGRALLLYSLCCLLWGSTWLVIKVGLDDLPPFLFAGVRMAVASLALAPLAFKAGIPRLAKGRWRWVVQIGALQMGLSYAAIFAAERMVSSGLTALLFCTYPILVVVLAHFQLPGERLTKIHLASVFFGFSGIALLQMPAVREIRWAPNVALALALPLLASLSSAVGNVWQKKHLGDVSLVINLWGQTLIGSCVLLSLHFATEAGAPAHWTLRSLGSLIYLAGPGTVVTFLCLFWLLPRVPMVVIGIIPILDTLIAVALGALVLHEPLGGRLIAAGVLILLGAALAARARSSPVDNLDLQAPEPSAGTGR